MRRIAYQAEFTVAFENKADQFRGGGRRCNPDTFPLG